MAPRNKTGASYSSLSPNDAISPGTPTSQSFPAVPLPRSASPSSGFTQFLSKPTRWFTRSASASKATTATAEPRSSTSSTTRKHKISRPTDPRPILDGYNAAAGSRSVLDFSQHRGPSSADTSNGRGGHPPSVPSSPTVGSGDLRSISRKAWSKSADDLSQITNNAFPSHANASFQDRINQYRTRSGSSASAIVAATPSSPVSARHPFPTGHQSPPPVPPLSSSPSSPTSHSSQTAHSKLPTVSVSVPPAEEGTSHYQKSTSPTNISNPPYTQSPVHTRSHSFTPKLSSKLARERFMSPSPKRKASADAPDPPPSPGPSSRGAFPFGLVSKSAAGAVVLQQQPDLGGHPGHGGHSHTGGGRTTTVGFGGLMAPPTIVEPGYDDCHDVLSKEKDKDSTDRDQKRASQILYYSGFINRLADSSSSNLHNVNLSSAKSWKPVKMELKGSKIYFYKPPSDRAAAIKDLFPTELVPPSVEEEEEAGELDAVDEDSTHGKGRRIDSSSGGGASGRKKRAFWGRRTHPELVLATGGKVEKGTFEAFVHEAVFGTTFWASSSSNPSSSSAITKDAEGGRDQGQQDEEYQSTQDEASQQKSDLPVSIGCGRRTFSWRDFASSILLCLPSLVGFSKFETEFLRCCSYLVSGASDDAEREEERKTVLWLAMEYLRYHGKPVDKASWEEWRAETLPDAPELGEDDHWDGRAGMPKSESMKALYVPSPMIGGVVSPQFNSFSTFSPRPEDPESKNTKLVSLKEALEGFGIMMSPQLSPVQMAPKSPETSRGMPPKSPMSPRKAGSLDLRVMEQQYQPPLYSPGKSGMPQMTCVRRVPWSALEKEGLSRDVLLATEPHILSQSLTLYHRTVLEQAPDSVTVASMLSSLSEQEGGEQQENEGREQETAPEFEARNLRPLFGSEDQPHWLTKLLLLQILGNDTSTGQVATTQAAAASSMHSSLASPGRKSEDRTAHTSRTHSRSEVISVWAKIGELCRIAGDECSWRAIMAALCSRPVARLDKVWKRVDTQALAVVESWVHPRPQASPVENENEHQTQNGNANPTGKVEEEGNMGDCAVQAGEPRSTPWGGSVKNRIKEALDNSRVVESEEVFKFESFNRARVLFEQFRTSFLLCPRQTFVVDGELDADVKRMVGFWRDMASEGGGVGGLAAKFQRVEQFMSLSLAAEPRRKGLFEPYYWTRAGSASQAQAGPNQSLLPLMFPETLPSLHLLDRTQLVRGRVDSDASDVFIRGSDQQRSQNIAQMQRNRELLNQQGTVIPVYNGELLLVVQKGDSSSRPPSYATSRPPSSIDDSHSSLTGHDKSDKIVSRSPSIRVRPGSSQRLERKTSMAKRSSMPSLSQRPNFILAEPSTNPPLRVVVQAGNLNVLMRILVQGLHGVSVSVADDNGEMSLREGISRELVLDRKEFAKVWWNVFRTFITPLSLFEQLRKMYITSQPPGSAQTVTVDDYLQIATSRSQVLDAIREWLSIGGGAQDILDDAQLYCAIRTFLDNTMDHAVFESEHFADPMVQHAWDGLKESRQSLTSFLISQTMRPRLIRVPQVHHHMRAGARMKSHGGREPPDIDRIDPEEFVDIVDGMVAAAFSNVTEEDLYVLADLLEVQTADRIGWFSHREVATVEENVDIQSMYTHLQEVEPSSLIPELGHESLYRMLPPSIRSCIRAYGILRKWLISKIIAPRLGLRGRQSRIEFLLQAIEVTRLRNMERPDPSQLVVQPCIRSFVEAIVSSALISVESRIHQRAWQSIAANRGVTCDSLMALMSRPYKDRANGHDLTVDMGWLIERMIEIVVSPDIIESAVNGGQSLVNFDKRRQLYNLINQSPPLSPAKRHAHSDEVNRRAFERLSNVEKEVMNIQFDHRGIREEAMREALHVTTSGTQSAKKIPRPFHKIVAYQMEKNRRDKNLRARLQKEKLHEQSRIEKRDDILNKALKSRKPQPSVQKQHRNKKSMSAFLSFMRPLSTAFGADTFQSPGLKRTASELDFKATGKPVQVLSLMDAHVAQFVNNERSYTFKLDTEDGGHYILQAVNRRELVKWLEMIGRIAKSATKRRLTYLGNSPKPMLSDHLHIESVAASRDPTAVFGVELDHLLQREAGGAVPPGTVPSIIHECLSEVESRGLSEVGIYRIAGAASEINALKDAFNRGEIPIRPETDIHAVCDLVKSWFRVLPEPIFPASSYHEIMQKMQLESLEERLKAIRSVVQRLPQANFDLLRRVSEHLDKVTDYEEMNQMTAEALAIVFSPNLLRAPQNDFVMILANMGNTHKLVKALITHHHVLFDEIDPEPEAHSGDEYDSPIPEEDEEEEEEEEGDAGTADDHNTSERDS
ncbi:rho GTPase activating protein 22 [Amanita muscaria]